MENSLNVAITPEEIIAQKDARDAVGAKKVNSFNAKNYLQARLTDKETEKRLTIRLLPFEPTGGTPFKKVHMHTIRVNKEVSPSGWKTFPCPIKNGHSDSCPLCEASEEARKFKFDATDDAKKKEYGNLEYANKASDMWIVRCIERGHEEDGVKFWLFRDSKKKDGAYDKIINIFRQRYDRGLELGKMNNIFDLNEGKDLIITLTKDSNGKTVVNVADDEEKTPLSTDYDLALSWVNDEKKWTDVYTFKPYEYMDLLLRGKVPFKVNGTFVDKEEYNMNKDKEIDIELSKVNADLSLGIDTSTTLTRDAVMQAVEDDSIPF